MVSSSTLVKFGSIMAVGGYTTYLAGDAFKDNLIQSASEAYEHAYGEPPSNPINGETWNPFRHAYTSAIMTQHFGSDAGQLFMDANEVRPNNSNDARRVDYYNNDVGADLFGDRQPSGGLFDVDTNLANDIKDLIRDPNDTGPYDPAKPLTDSADFIPDGYNHDSYFDGLDSTLDTIEKITNFFDNLYKTAKDSFDRNFGNHNDTNGDGREDGGAGGANGGNGGAGENGPKPPTKPNDEGGQASPLVLDLDGDGIELYAVNDYGTYFDLLGDGQAVLTGWVDPDDGLLAIDTNGDGVINDISELFGNETTDGFTELAFYDTNNDDVIDAQDTQFHDLLIWRDSNSDGFSQADELATLSELNIISINLDATRLPNIDQVGNTITHESSFTINGQEQTIVDAWFAYDPQHTRNAQSYDLDLRALSLPTFRGFGDLKDFYVALSLDNGTDADTLMSQVTDLSDGLTLSNAFADMDAITPVMDDILLRWAGVDGVDPNGRGDYVNGQHLAFNEAFRGEPFDQYGLSNPLPEAGAYSEAVYDYFKTFYTAQFLAQIVGDDIFVDAQYDLYTAGFSGDLTLVQSGIDIIQATASDINNDAQDVWTHFAQFLGYAKGLGNLTQAEITALDNAVVATGSAGLSSWQSVVSLMSASLGDIIESPDDWGSFEIYYDNYVGGTAGDDVLDDSDTGSFIDNQLVGFDGNDTIRGFAGHDKLEGRNGNDILDGGAGDDYLLGGTGDDTYIYNGGNDTISEDNGGGNDTLIISASTGLGETDIVDMFRYQDELLLTLSNGDTITIDGYATTGQEIETILFETDNHTIDLASLINQKFYGTESIDHLTVSGSSIQELSVYGYEGNDTLTGNGSTLRLYGGDGYDVLIGNYLNDYLSGGSQEDYLFGEDGNDSLYGGDGNDTLDGGAGDDYLHGGDGQDTFLFGINDGDDFVERQRSADNTQIVFEDGITASDINILRTHGDQRDITLDVAGQNTSVTLEDFNAKNGSWIYLVGAIEFDDGVTWDSQTLRSQYLTTHTTAGDDVVIGFEGHETYLASAGNDSLRGYDGDDTYHWGAGMGNDIVIEEGNNSNNGKDNDRIVFDGLNFSDLTVDISGTDLIFTNASTNEILTVDSQIFQRRGDYRIDYYDFADGSTLTQSQLEETFAPIYRDFDGSSADTYGFAGVDVVNGGVGIDEIYGRAGNDILLGGGWNDRLYGGSGDDVLNGGTDTDRLYGGSGVDEFIFDAGFEDDRIHDFEVGEKINFASITTLTSINDFTITASGTDTLITVAGEGTILIDDIDATYWTASDFVFGITGTTSGEALYGGDTADHINGLAGLDFLHGNGGNDVILGGYGEDRIYGHDGDDILNGERDNDIIYGHLGNDTIYGDHGWDALYGLEGDDIIWGGIGDDVIRGDDDANADNFIGAGNDELHGGDGSDKISGGAGDDVLYGDDGNDTLYGNAGADTLYGGNHVDRLYGYADNDTIYGDAGNDYLYGGLGNDTLDGGDGSDRVYGNEGNDIIHGGSDNDYLYGLEDDDTIYGDAGTDRIYGHEGNDTLDGGDDNDFLWGLQGDDTLIGGLGNDRLIGDNDPATSNYANAGQDMLYGNEGNDILGGGANDDVLYGGAGVDALYGNDGADTFAYQAGDVDGTMDYIHDFSFAENDAIDIADVIDFNSANGDAISDYVFINNGSYHAQISIDQDGTGTAHSATIVTQIQSNTGLDLNTLIANGSLIVE